MTLLHDILITYAGCSTIHNIHISLVLSGDALKEVVEGFNDKLGVPQCAGSNDGSHIPVSPPAMIHTDYYSQKGWYLIRSNLENVLIIGTPNCNYSNSWNE